MTEQAGIRQKALTMKILLKNLLFTLAVPGTVGVYLPLYIGTHGEGIAGWWNWSGIPLLAAGYGALLVSILDFMTKGEGTPFPLDPPKNLVTGRLYRYTRNPMYMGLFAVLTGWALWFSSVSVVLYALLASTVVQLFVIFVEEPFLKRQFGAAYDDYFKKVPRWF